MCENLIPKVSFLITKSGFSDGGIGWSSKGYYYFSNGSLEYFAGLDNEFEYMESETEEEFERSRDFIDSMDFYEMHVFPYSVRKGTSAEKMEGQLSMKEKSARASELIKISERKAKLYRESFINKKLKVLWETEETVNEKVYMVGHTERYVRAAFPIGGCCSEAPKSGEITEITAKMLLNDNTLLADIDFC